MASIKNLSPKAKRIVKHIASGRSLKWIMEKYPDLSEALDEYNDWCSDQAPTSSPPEEPPPISHPLLRK